MHRRLVLMPLATGWDPLRTHTRPAEWDLDLLTKPVRETLALIAIDSRPMLVGMARTRNPAKRSSPYPVGARSFELKLQRAALHLRQLQLLRTRWIAAALKTLREEPDPPGSGYHAAWFIPPPFDNAELSLLAGDYLQCLRSSLDHLAFDLTSNFTVPMTADIERDTAFPILGDLDRAGNEGAGRKRWAKSGLALVRGMELGAQAAIESLQPYQRGDVFEDDPLWILSQLNNVDKHRALHVVGASLAGVILSAVHPKIPKADWPRNVAYLGREDNEPWVLESKDVIAAKGRTKVARWAAVPIDASKPMRVGIKPNLDLVFVSGTPLVGGRSVAEVFRDLSNHLLHAVVPPLRGFLK